MQSRAAEWIMSWEEGEAEIKLLYETAPACVHACIVSVFAHRMCACKGVMMWVLETTFQAAAKCHAETHWP